MAEFAAIFINWRTPGMTLDAIRSLRKWFEENPNNLRLIIVDNGSGDESCEIFRTEVPQATLIEMSGNMGFAKAANAGLKAVEEPFAFILNTDVIFENNALAILADALKNDPNGMLACPRLLNEDSSFQAAAVNEPKIYWELTNRSLPRRFLKLHDEKPSIVPGVVGPCMAVHMERIKTVGFLDERFFFFFEETDWCKRITDSGGHVLFVPEARVTHLQGKSANTNPAGARIQFYKSRYKYFRKHNGIFGVAMLYLGVTVRLAVNTIVYLLIALLTLLNRKKVRKLAVTWKLLQWHLLFCRPRWAFEK